MPTRSGKGPNHRKAAEGKGALSAMAKSRMAKRSRKSATQKRSIPVISKKFSRQAAATSASDTLAIAEKLYSRTGHLHEEADQLHKSIHQAHVTTRKLHEQIQLPSSGARIYPHESADQ